MQNTRFIALCLGICCSLLVNVVWAKGKIATVSPISHSLSQAMVQNTPIEVAYLPPTRLPVNRLASWVRKHANDKFEYFDAFVDISAVSPALDLFPSLRVSNIRLVNIDIAQAIMPNGEKVVQANSREYFWLNSNNLLVMLGILKRDVSALWPEYREQFNQNYQTLAAGIRQVNLQLDELLIANDVAFIVPANDKLLPFSASLATDTSSEQEALALGLNYLVLASGKQKQTAAWQVDDFSRFSQKGLLTRLDSHVVELTRLLTQLK